MYKYQEDYQQALDGYKKASELEPSWASPKHEIQQIEEFLAKIEFYLSKKGVKPKKLESVTQSIKDYTTQNKLPKLTPLSQLTLGINKGTVIIGKVLFVVNSKHFLPL